MSTIRKVTYSVVDEKLVCTILMSNNKEISSDKFMMITCYDCAKKHAFKNASNKVRKEVRNNGEAFTN